MQSKQSRRFAVGLRGEAFRFGKSGSFGSHLMPSNFSITKQKDAAKMLFQHLIDPLKSRGYEVDVFGVTYFPKLIEHQHLLEQLYWPSLRILKWQNKSAHRYQGNQSHTIINLVKANAAVS